MCFYMHMHALTVCVTPCVLDFIGLCVFVTECAYHALPRKVNMKGNPDENDVLVQ